LCFCEIKFVGFNSFLAEEDGGENGIEERREERRCTVAESAA
jgi:hypothetical protein